MALHETGPHPPMSISPRYARQTSTRPRLRHATARTLTGLGLAGVLVQGFSVMCTAALHQPQDKSPLPPSMKSFAGSSS